MRENHREMLLDTHIVLSAAGEAAKLSEAARTLPLLHKDPFDRLFLAQTRTEGTLLLTVDASVSKYKESVLTF